MFFLINCILILLDYKYDYIANSTILFFYGNSALYEYFYIQQGDIKYYTNRNINIVFYNYRGYGDTPGDANPYTQRKDGEAVIDYLRNTLGIKKLGLHGHSIGGLSAVLLANRKKVELLIADRTFSSIADVV